VFDEQYFATFQAMTESKSFDKNDLFGVMTNMFFSPLSGDFGSNVIKWITNQGTYDNTVSFPDIGGAAQGAVNRYHLMRMRTTTMGMGGAQSYFNLKISRSELAVPRLTINSMTEMAYDDIDSALFDGMKKRLNMFLPAIPEGSRMTFLTNAIPYSACVPDYTYLFARLFALAMSLANGMNVAAQALVADQNMVLMADQISVDHVAGNMHTQRVFVNFQAIGIPLTNGVCQVFHQAGLPNVGVAVGPLGHVPLPAAAFNSAYPIHLFTQVGQRPAAFNAVPVNAYNFVDVMSAIDIVIRATRDYTGLGKGYLLACGVMRFYGPEQTCLPTAPTVRFHNISPMVMARARVWIHIIGSMNLGAWVLGAQAAIDAYLGGAIPAMQLAVPIAVPAGPLPAGIAGIAHVLTHMSWPNNLNNMTCEGQAAVLTALHAHDPIIFINALVAYGAGGMPADPLPGAPVAYLANRLNESNTIPAMGLDGNVVVGASYGLHIIKDILTSVSMKISYAGVSIVGTPAMHFKKGFLLTSSIMRSLADCALWSFKTSAAVDVSMGYFMDFLNLDWGLSLAKPPLKFDCVRNAFEYLNVGFIKLFGDGVQLLSDTAVSNSYVLLPLAQTRNHYVMPIAFSPELRHMLIGTRLTSGGLRRKHVSYTVNGLLEKGLQALMKAQSSDVYLADVLGLLAEELYVQGLWLEFGVNLEVTSRDIDSNFVPVPLPAASGARVTDYDVGLGCVVTAAVHYISNPFVERMRPIAVDQREAAVDGQMTSLGWISDAPGAAEPLFGQYAATVGYNAVAINQITSKVQFQVPPNAIGAGNGPVSFALNYCLSIIGSHTHTGFFNIASSMRLTTIEPKSVRFKSATIEELWSNDLRAPQLLDF